MRSRLVLLLALTAAAAACSTPPILPLPVHGAAHDGTPPSDSSGVGGGIGSGNGG